MTKEDCIKIQEDIFRKLETIMKDIKNCQDCLIDFDDNLINNEVLELPEDEAIIGVYKWNDGRKVEIMSMKEIEAISYSLNLCTRTGLIDKDKFIKGKDMHDYLENENKK